MSRPGFSGRTAVSAVALALCAGLIVGCSSGSSDSDSNTSSVSGTQQTATTEADQTPKEPEITFTEQVVIDNDACKITITEIDEDGFWGYGLKAQLENKSTDKTYMYAINEATVNGVDCDPFFASEVAAGKKSNETISFSLGDLEDYGVGAPTDIMIHFRVYDSDDWSAEDVANEIVHIYPYGEDYASTYVREAQSSDVVLVDNDQVSVTVIGYTQDSIWGYGVNVYLVNKTDTAAMFAVDDAAVNGFMADPYWATSVPAHASAFSSINWSDSTLEDNNITEVQEISFTLVAHDDESWNSDRYVEETITLEP